MYLFNCFLKHFFGNFISGRENEQKFKNNKNHVRKTWKTNPSLTKKIRTILEQNLLGKLESLGINAVSLLIF